MYGRAVLANSGSDEAVLEGHADTLKLSQYVQLACNVATSMGVFCPRRTDIAYHCFSEISPMKGKDSCPIRLVNINLIDDQWQVLEGVEKFAEEDERDEIIEGFFESLLPVAENLFEKVLTLRREIATNPATAEAQVNELYGIMKAVCRSNDSIEDFLRRLEHAKSESLAHSERVLKDEKLDQRPVSQHFAARIVKHIRQQADDPDVKMKRACAADGLLHAVKEYLIFMNDYFRGKRSQEPLLAEQFIEELKEGEDRRVDKMRARVVGQPATELTRFLGDVIVVDNGRDDEVFKLRFRRVLGIEQEQCRLDVKFESGNKDVSVLSAAEDTAPGHIVRVTSAKSQDEKRRSSMHLTTSNFERHETTEEFRSVKEVKSHWRYGGDNGDFFSKGSLVDPTDPFSLSTSTEGFLNLAASDGEWAGDHLLPAKLAAVGAPGASKRTSHASSAKLPPAMLGHSQKDVAVKSQTPLTAGATGGTPPHAPSSRASTTPLAASDIAANGHISASPTKPPKLPTGRVKTVEQKVGDADLPGGIKVSTQPALNTADGIATEEAPDYPPPIPPTKQTPQPDVTESTRSSSANFRTEAASPAPDAWQATMNHRPQASQVAPSSSVDKGSTFPTEQSASSSQRVNVGYKPVYTGTSAWSRGSSSSNRSTQRTTSASASEIHQQPPSLGEGNQSWTEAPRRNPAPKSGESSTEGNSSSLENRTSPEFSFRSSTKSSPSSGEGASWGKSAWVVDPSAPKYWLHRAGPFSAKQSSEGVWRSSDSLNKDGAGSQSLWRQPVGRINSRASPAQGDTKESVDVSSNLQRSNSVRDRSANGRNVPTLSDTYKIAKERLENFFSKEKDSKAPKPSKPGVQPK